MLGGPLRPRSAAAMLDRGSRCRPFLPSHAIAGRRSADLCSPAVPILAYPLGCAPRRSCRCPTWPSYARVSVPAVPTQDVATGCYALLPFPAAPLPCATSRSCHCEPRRCCPLPCLPVHSCRCRPSLRVTRLSCHYASLRCRDCLCIPHRSGQSHPRTCYPRRSIPARPFLCLALFC